MYCEVLDRVVSRHHYFLICYKDLVDFYQILQVVSV